jgi:endonuclease/exonuclease/phosphatase family metal-dependent hydrolase
VYAHLSRSRDLWVMTERRRGTRTLAGSCLVVLAVLLSGLPAGGGAAAAAAEVRVMTYNVHWGEHVDGRSGKWSGRVDLRRISRDIRRSGAEVVAVQEVHTYRIGRRILSEAHELARLLGWTRGGVRRHVLTRGSHPVAIWCRRKSGVRVVKRLDGRPATCLTHGNAIIAKSPLFHGRFIDLFRPVGDPLGRDLYGTDEGRSGLLAAILVGGRRVWIASVHLARIPAIGACQLRDLLAELADARPLMLAGDFNMQIDTEVARSRCDGVLPRPLDQLGPAGLVRGAPGGRTYPAHVPVEHIDHIFASPPLSVLGVRAVNNCFGGICSSDHRPLAALLRLPD